MNKGVPKYIAISKEIIQKIESGELQPGDKIPSENELIKMYSISNTTARKSLLEIELNGWANRIKGKGTFVLNRSEDKHLTRVLGSFHAMKESFSDNLIKEGFTPKNIILEKITLEEGISSSINNRHYIMEGPVLKIHRLRYADEVLLKDETRYISMSICPKIHLVDLEQSLIKVYEEKYQLALGNVERTLSNTIIYPQEPNNYFENEIPIAVFILDGAIFCQDGRLVEIEKSLYRGDKYKFTISTKPQLISNK
ncbi:GntR family transcriptional regulator [Gaoshiqia sp. Z1-71]|uniref:GntR family transcriptional regulator n=1 Tax=Gaoshiqia hydrogeniformans TaxID=3290090 RepID=UPI003BF785F1